MTDRQTELIADMQAGNDLILTYMGSYLLRLPGLYQYRHYFYSEIYPLINDGVIYADRCEGMPPGSSLVYKLTENQ